MKTLQLIFTAVCSIVLLSCNKHITDIPEEEYGKIFNIKSPDKPYINYEDMVIHPCNPTESELNFKYPGVEIEGKKRKYTVTLEMDYREQKHYKLEPNPNSQFEVRYVDNEGKLVVLRNYEHEGKPFVLENGKWFTQTFTVESGYPLYLAVSGYGFNQFDIYIRLYATAEDGVVEVPEINYAKYFSKDGDVTLEPFCQKVILP